MKTSSVFVYGTLTSPRVVQILLGHNRARHIPATLRNYRRHPVIGYAFPGMIPVKESVVSGNLLADLTETDMKLLDWFEGDEYDRRRVQVECNEEEMGTKVVETDAYIWKQSLLPMLDQSQDWSYDKFCTEKLDWYIENTVKPCREETEKLGMTK